MHNMVIQANLFGSFKILMFPPPAPHTPAISLCTHLTLHRSCALPSKWRENTSCGTFLQSRQLPLLPHPFPQRNFKNTTETPC